MLFCRGNNRVKCEVSSPFVKPTTASGVYTRGKRWFEKKKKKKLIARVGIRGHIYYMNKKRQFLNSLWPFCMIKINLALKNWSFATQCQLISNDAKIQSQHVHKKQSKRCKKTTQFDGPTRAWFPFGPNNNVFFAESVVGEQPSTTNRIASRGSPHDPTMRSRPCDPTARSLHTASPPSSF